MINGQSLLFDKQECLGEGFHFFFLKNCLSIKPSPNFGNGSILIGGTIFFNLGETGAILSGT